MKCPGIYNLILIISLLVAAEIRTNAQASPDTSTLDHHSHILLVPKVNLRIIYPEDGMYGNYDIDADSEYGQIAHFSIGARYENVILSAISVTDFDSVDAFSKRFLKSGEQWSVDASEYLESGQDFLNRKKYFEERDSTEYFTGYADYGGRHFATKYSGCQGGSCLFKSHTFVNDNRVEIIMITPVIGDISQVSSDTLMRNCLKILELVKITSTH